MCTDLEKPAPAHRTPSPNTDRHGRLAPPQGQARGRSQTPRLTSRRSNLDMRSANAGNAPPLAQPRSIGDFRAARQAQNPGHPAPNLAYPVQNQPFHLQGFGNLGPYSFLVGRLHVSGLHADLCSPRTNPSWGCKTSLRHPCIRYNPS